MKTSEIFSWLKNQRAKGLSDSKINALFNKLQTKNQKRYATGQKHN